MRWTCPKCGKKLNVSDKQLLAKEGLIVCPLCGLQARQPLPKSGSSSGSKPARKPSSSPSTTRRMKSSTPTPLSAVATSQQGEQSPDATPRPRKKTKKKNNQDGMSGWGCLLRSIIATLILFAAYVFFGLLLDAVQ